MSDQTLLSVKEMIEYAFGDKKDKNKINFNMMHAVMLLIATQLRILERRIGVDIGWAIDTPPSQLSVSEVKIHAKKKKKGKPLSPGHKQKGFHSKLDLTKPPPPPSSGKKPDDLEEISKKSVDSWIIDKVRDKQKEESFDTTKSIGTQKEDSPELKDKTKSTGKTDKKVGGSESKRSARSAEAKEKEQENLTRLLERIEEDKERVLRIINQRANSREENLLEPSPMASMDSVDLQYEKLLVVERIPVEEAEARIGTTKVKKTKEQRVPRLSIVTTDQFKKLEDQVKAIEDTMGVIGTAEFPENIQLMRELRRGASLTDSLAALQLSARLEAVEKALGNTMGIVTELAVKMQTEAMVDITRMGMADGNQTYKPVGTKSELPGTAVAGDIQTQLVTDIEAKTYKPFGTGDSDSSAEDNEGKKEGHISFVTREEQANILQTLREELLAEVGKLVDRISVSADQAAKIAHRAEGKLSSALSLGDRIDRVERAVSHYVEQVNVLDTGLSSQLTNYHEQLTQMQHDLDSGMENITEAIANQGGDTDAVNDLFVQFNNLQMDFERTKAIQKDLEDSHMAVSNKVQNLLDDIEILRDVKCDRDEFADALRDKAGISALNGMVTISQFEAVEADFERKIRLSYDKFNNQEVIWQKAIDDLLRDINEKADLEQVEFLQSEVERNLNMLQTKVDAMLEVVGEPRAAALKKRLFRDTECISCSTPAFMVSEDTVKLSRNRKEREKARSEPRTIPKDDGDHGICYPGYPVPHSIDPRANFCSRYCGGSHTMITPGRRTSALRVRRLPPPTPEPTVVSEVQGEQEGESEGTDEMNENKLPSLRKPCGPCNTRDVQKKVDETEKHKTKTKRLSIKKLATEEIEEAPEDDEKDENQVKEKVHRVVTEFGVSSVTTLDNVLPDFDFGFSGSIS